MALESWSIFPDSLFNNSNSGDNEALTNALLSSLSAESFPIGSPIRTRPAPLLLPEPATRNPITGKITKRKSRASKKSPTTYITADPANFRQMVQQVTGVRFGGQPVGLIPVQPLARPEPVRGGLGMGMGMPTLDTSAGLLDRARLGMVEGFGSVGPAGSEFDFDGFSSFPTLESWAAM